MDITLHLHSIVLLIRKHCNILAWKEIMDTVLAAINIIRKKCTYSSAVQKDYRGCGS